MKQFTPEQKKINEKIASSIGVSEREVEEAISSYWKGISIKIRVDEPCEIIVPYLGKFFPKKTLIKKFNEQHEANNTRERIANIQSGMPDDKGI